MGFGAWSGKRGSNPRPSAWKADALPTELFPPEAAGHRDLRKDKVRWWGMVDLNHRRHTPTGLQPVPFGRSGNPPKHLSGPCGPRKPRLSESCDPWSWRWDSNPQPSVYKTDALPIELRQHKVRKLRASRGASYSDPPGGCQHHHGFFSSSGSNSEASSSSGSSRVRTVTCSRACPSKRDSSRRGTTRPSRTSW